MRSFCWRAQTVLATLAVFAAGVAPTFAQQLIGTYTINNRYNAAGCNPQFGGNGNPYYCPDPIGPGPFFINNPTPGQYQLVITGSGPDGIANSRLWIGTANGGVGYYINPLGGTTLNFTVPAGQNIVLYAWDWYDYDNDPNQWTMVNLYSSGCQVKVNYQPGPPLSRDGQFTSMIATFTPTSGTLIDAAKACGFQGFEWQQTITNLPCPSPFDANLSQGNKCPDGFLMAPPEFNDPPPGGYTAPPYYLNDLKNYSFPFYYPEDIALREENNPSASTFCIAGKDCSFGLCIGPDCTLLVSLDGTTLSFHDAPSDPCLPGADPAKNLAFCSGNTARQNPYMAFTTSLVGINQDDTASAPLNGGQRTWTDTYNGTSGGIPTTLNSLPVDPGGTGGVTITSINGVQLPPAVPPSQVATTASGLAYSRVTKTFNGTVTIQNISGSPINGPLQILFFGMPVNVTLVNATRNLSGTPYLTVPALASLAPGQSVTVSVQFKNPSNGPINFTPVIYSGSMN